MDMEAEADDELGDLFASDCPPAGGHLKHQQKKLKPRVVLPPPIADPKVGSNVPRLKTFKQSILQYGQATRTRTPEHTTTTADDRVVRSPPARVSFTHCGVAVLVPPSKTSYKHFIVEGDDGCFYRIEFSALSEDDRALFSKRLHFIPIGFDRGPPLAATASTNHRPAQEVDLYSGLDPKILTSVPVVEAMRRLH